MILEILLAGRVTLITCRLVIGKLIIGIIVDSSPDTSASTTFFVQRIVTLLYQQWISQLVTTFGNKQISNTALM